MKVFSGFFAFFLIIASFSSVSAQFSENFDDGNFISAPAWHGDSTLFEVVGGELHLDDIPETGSAMMVTESEVLISTTWTFQLRMEFNPSSQNYTDVYLVSDSKDLHNPLNGYFVRIGYSTDAVSLYRQEGDRSGAVKIISGEEDRTDVSPVEIRVRVTRDSIGGWILYSDVGLAGDFVLEGTATDHAFSGSKYFGVHCRYTKTRANRFFFDDFIVDGVPCADSISPLMDSVALVSRNIIKGFFSELVLDFPGGIPENYWIEHNGETWARALSVQINSDVAQLEFDKDFQADETYQLCIERLVDSCLNSTELQRLSFVYHPPYQAVYRDVVINEMMIDPYPTIGLPNAEYVELYNRSEEVINLENWRLGGSGNAAFPEYHLMPGAYVILARTSTCSLFNDPVLSWGSSGSLLNGGEPLWLRNASGVSIDSIHYDLSWYKDTQKDDGGWSLEQINPLSICSGPDNWSASIDTTGGTPGVKNSVFDTIPDIQPPDLISLEVNDSVTLTLTFSEAPVNFSNASCLIHQGPQVEQITTGPEINQLRVIFQLPFEEGEIYELNLQDISDCMENEMENEVRSFFFDTRPPFITSVTTLKRSKIRVHFNEKIDEKSVRRLEDSFVLPQQIQPVKIELAGDSSVYMIFSELLWDGSCTIVYRGIADLAGNTVEYGIFQFDFQLPLQPGFNEVVISEFMADPDPVQGLPQFEYVELYNASGQSLRLVDALLQVGQKQKVIEELYIEAGEYVVLCKNSAVSHFPSNVHVEGLSNWPILKNRGDTLMLFRNDGKLIFATYYDKSWYQSMEKQAGGWSLEMIDLNRGCAGKNNWKASENLVGGTPGMENSVSWQKPDQKGPELISAAAFDSVSIILQFSERLHPDELSFLNVVIEPALAVVEKTLIMPFGDMVLLQVNDRILSGVTYELQIDNAIDCSGNPGGKTGKKVVFVLPVPPVAGDVVINEILFHPRSGGVEFVELYNRSDKHINLNGLTIAIERDGKYLRKQGISYGTYVYEPGHFLALTKNAFILKGDYPMGEMTAFFQMSLPQLHNDEGTVVLLGRGGEVIDKTYYNDDMHHRLIVNSAGVSLERTSLGEETGDELLWHSAAASAGYATPGKMNSQYMQTGISEEFVVVEPRVIAPNSPGIRDFAEISFLFVEPGMMATIEVYDIRGRKVRTLAKNELLALEGSYLWRGDDDSGRGVTHGQYIVRLELYNSEGRHSVIKKTLVVGRHF